MGFKMVHGDEGQIMRKRHPFGKGSAYDQATNKARASRGCHTAKFSVAEACPCKNIGHKVRQILQMRPGGDFGHNAAKSRMFGLLAENRFRRNGAIRAHKGGSGFVAATFNS
jgi:hypothetical protein